MTVQTIITRADFVRQDDGTTAWAIEVSRIAPSPFDPEETITQRFAAMPPERALADHGLTLSDVVEGINDSLAADVGVKQAQVQTLQAEKAALIAELDTLHPQTINGVPQEVAMNRARKALALAGLLPQVEAVVAAAPGAEGDLIRIDWQYATGMKRQAPFVLTMAAALGLTDEQVDALFVQAAALP